MGEQMVEEKEKYIYNIYERVRAPVSFIRPFVGHTGLLDIDHLTM